MFSENDGLDDIFNNLSAANIEQIRACEPGEAQLFNILIRQYNIAQTLDAPFYLQTELPRTRNLINFPEFQVCSYQDIIKPNQFTWHFFYNYTPRKNYTKTEDYVDGTRIGSYVDVNCGGPISNFIKVLLQQTIVSQLTPLSQLKFPLIFGNMSNMHLEEVRIGGLAHWYHAFNDKTYLEIKVPMFWMVKYLQMTQCEKDTIEAEFTAYSGSNFGSFDLNQWARQHIVFDAIGTGTTEISLCSRAMSGSNWHIDAGAFLFLPTDYPWKKGLYGTYIEPSNQFPILNLCDLINITSASLNPNASTIMYNYFT
ncbi:hypothetical protein KAZ82_02515, partial [Candidatus Babeliales bacterium]|nr:hypothetical protein [Candidatus Babeliales bacterium]